MPVHRYVVTVRTEKSGGGTFKSGDEIGEYIQESIEASNPGSVTVDETEYEVTDFEVEEIDAKGQPVPWSEEAEQRSKARAEKAKDERVKADAIARKKHIAYEAEQKRRREEAPDGRVYKATYGNHGPEEEEIGLGQYERIVFEINDEFLKEHPKAEPLKVTISRDRHDPTRLEIRGDPHGIITRPYDSVSIKVMPTRDFI